MTIKKRYEWRELTDDGLLRTPKEVGPHYGKDNVNYYHGFDSEEDAIMAYEEFRKRHEWDFHELVLVTIYKHSHE